MELEKRILETIDEYGVQGKRIANILGISEGKFYIELAKIRKNIKKGTFQEERLRYYDLERGLCPSRTLDFIEKNPGHKNSEIALKFNVSETTVENQMRLLKDLSSKEEAVAKIMEKNENYKELNRLKPLFDVIVNEPGLQNKELMGKMGWNHGKISRWINRLENLRDKIPEVDEAYKKHLDNKKDLRREFKKKWRSIRGRADREL